MSIDDSQVVILYIVTMMYLWGAMISATAGSLSGTVVLGTCAIITTIGFAFNILEDEQ